MRPSRIIVALLVVSALWAVGSSVALAADPPSFSAATIAQTGFEEASYPAWFSAKTLMGGAPFWGRVSGAGASGYGLWVAGSVPASWPYYPEGTFCQATLDLGSAGLGATSLKDYYDSSLSMWYKLPSIRRYASTVGTATIVYESDRFSVLWRASGEPTIYDEKSNANAPSDFPLTSAFVKKAWSLSAPANAANLSRRDGRVEITLAPPLNYPIAGNVAGPTIDDIAITGFKYGPVRSLALDAGGTKLTWARPYRSTFATGAEERTISYRIWRRGLLDASYTELTSDGARLPDDTTSFTDGDGGPGKYAYVVQAWDPGAGTGYGLIARAGSLTGVSVSVSPGATKVKAGGSVTLTYNVVNIGTTTLSSVLVTDKAGVVGTVGSIAAGATNSTLKRVVNPLVDTTFESRASGSGVSATGSASVRVPVQRLAGADRIGTAIAISKRAFPGTAPAVVLATSMRWQEPLVAASLAGQVQGPLLLVKPTTLPAEVVAEINRLNPSVIYVVGDATSKYALGAATYSALQKSFGAKLQPRIAGTDSYGTSREVAAKVTTLKGATGGTLFLARGDGDLNFADALAASSLSARLRAPIVLTAPTSLLAAANTAITTVKPAEIVVCGGTGAVSATVAEAAAGAAGLGVGGYDRRGGGTRYETASLIADYGVAKLGQPSIAYVANGLNYPDALGGGVLAGIGTTAWQPVLLTASASLSTPVSSFITGHASVNHATILGGTGSVAAPVVPAAIETALFNLIP